MIDNCAACQKTRPSQQPTPMTAKKPSESQGAPLEHVGTDLFEYAGKHYLVVVDRFSGYPLVKQLHKTDTGAVIRKMTEWFNLLGWPRSMRSDGGPQYRAELDAFCIRNNITHELSSACNPQSNGLAEAAVKNVKQLLEKCSLEGECFESALYSWRNVPRGEGGSPVELLFGCLLYTSPSPRDGLLSRMPSSA